MATPNEKLAASLTVLRDLQKSGRRVFQSQELTRVHRERLIRSGFLQEVMKGWLISSSPGVRDGDGTPWYASFWEFCARYCAERFGEEWHLSPEQSLLLHAEKSVIPSQVIVHSPKAANHKVSLLFGTSLYDLKRPQMPATSDLILRDDLRLFTSAAAIIRVPESFFTANPVETQVVLASLRDASELLRRLLDGGHSVVAGRLAGALRHIGRPDAADEIVTTMRAAGYDARESDPFGDRATVAAAAPAAPIVGRIQAMWEAMRGKVLAVFPPPPGLPSDRTAFLQFVDDIYQSDAYNSLSIEGYTVSVALVERVREGNWDPDHHDDDRQSRDTLAARGYWQAFRVVKANVEEIIAGVNAGGLVRTAHRDWYRELFQPCVSAGLIAPSALAGYRNDAVYLRTSRYVPPRWEAVRDAMPALFDLLEHETEPGVRAVLGHWLFGYVHPYPDGNGRMARFLMNAMLASGGYPWTVVRIEDRACYLAALDRASIDTDIAPFAEFIAERVRWSLQQSA
jgi:fido (protein-threonine AMPylation protein)